MASRTKTPSTAQASATAVTLEGALVMPPFCRTTVRPARPAKRSKPTRGNTSLTTTRTAPAASTPTARMTSMASRLGPKASRRSLKPLRVFRTTSSRTSFMATLPSGVECPASPAGSLA